MLLQKATASSVPICFRTLPRMPAACLFAFRLLVHASRSPLPFTVPHNLQPPPPQLPLSGLTPRLRMGSAVPHACCHYYVAATCTSTVLLPRLRFTYRTGCLVRVFVLL